MNRSTDPGLLQMAGPLIVSFWMRSVVTFVDTIYGAILGDDAVAAIGLTIPVEFLMIAIWVGLSTGLTSALSRAMGANHGRKIEQYLKVSSVLVWGAAILFTVVGAALWFVAPRLELDAAVARDLQVYGTVLVVGSAFTTFWSILPDSIVKAHHDTRSTMWAGIWTNLLNVVLNTLFLFVFHWGVFGIAFSTVISRLGGLVYAIARARHHERLRRQADPDPAPELDPEPYGRILRLAVPSSLTFVLMALEGAVVNALLAKMKHATEAIASYAIYYRIVLFAIQPVIATAVAMLPYAARRFGQGDVSGVRDGIRNGLLAMSVYSIVILGPLALGFGPWLAGMLTESEVAGSYTSVALRIVPLACITGSPFLLCRPVFEALGRGGPGLIMAAIRYLLLTGPLAWGGMVIADRLGQPGIFGLIFGLLIAGTLPSIGFYLWTRSTLNHLAADEARKCCVRSPG